jgi:periplasmic divalent cation tolerance protein
MEQWIVIKTTADKKETLAVIAKTLVAERLCGCAQISGPIDSHYRWSEQLEHSEEYELSIKTARDLFATVAARIKSLHSYDVPQIIAIPITQISKDYEAWLRGNLDLPK